MSVAAMTEHGPASPAHARKGDAPRQRAFAIAQRHSKVIKVLKVAVPLVAIVLVGAFATASYLLTPAKVSIDTDGTALVDGKLVMANPKLEGMTKEGQTYKLSAVRAIQDLSNQSVIELETINASLPLSEKQRVFVAAPKGVYDREANTLRLTEPFRLKTTDGMSAGLTSAFLDIGNEVMETPDPVDIRINGSIVKANSLKIIEKGKMFVFENNVRVTIEPSRLQQMRSGNGETQ